METWTPIRSSVDAHFTHSMCCAVCSVMLFHRPWWPTPRSFCRLFTNLPVPSDLWPLTNNKAFSSFWHCRRLFQSVNPQQTSGCGKLTHLVPTTKLEGPFLPHSGACFDSPPNLHVQMRRKEVRKGKLILCTKAKLKYMSFKYFFLWWSFYCHTLHKHIKLCTFYFLRLKNYLIPLCAKVFKSCSTFSKVNLLF